MQNILLALRIMNWLLSILSAASLFAAGRNFAELSRVAHRVPAWQWAIFVGLLVVASLILASRHAVWKWILAALSRPPATPGVAAPAKTPSVATVLPDVESQLGNLINDLVSSGQHAMSGVLLDAAAKLRAMAEPKTAIPTATGTAK